jgi:hypothetical protein
MAQASSETASNEEDAATMQSRPIEKPQIIVRAKMASAVFCGRVWGRYVAIVVQLGY